MGQRIGCGAHLTALRRTEFAEFKLGEAHTLDDFASLISAERGVEALVHPRKLLPRMPSVVTDEGGMAYFRSGRAVNLPEFSNSALVKVFYGQKEFLGIAQRVAGTLFRPKIVFAEKQER